MNSKSAETRAGYAEQGREKMTLYKMGNAFDSGTRKESDVGNYRVRAVFTDRAGVDVVADFGSWSVVDDGSGHFGGFYCPSAPYGSGKKGIPHVNALHLDAAYKDAEETWRDYVYTCMNDDYDYTLKYDYTIAGIRAFLSDITGQAVDELELADYMPEEDK